MVQELSIISVNLASVCMESFLYGIFVLLFGVSTYLLIRRGERQRQMSTSGATRPMWKTPMFIAAMIMACTVTAHWILTVVRLFDAFVNYEGGTKPLVAYGDLSFRTEVVKTAFLVMTILTSDIMIIYRLYIVWSYNYWIVIFPMLTWCGLIACGTGVCWQFAVYTLGEDVFETSAGRWITSDCVFTFTTNVYCSILIAWRVWRTRIHTQSYGGANIMGALAIIIESAALQSSWNLIFFITYQVKSNIQFTTCDLWGVIAGISFMLINLRVSLGWAQKANQQTSSLPRLSAQGRSMVNEQGYAMRPLAVNITRVVNQEDDFGSPIKKQDLESQGSVLPV
ncbi:uncharacterized protein LAESUDRAFT_527375 [Laetiporus sulphureus 93-53]|uniref:Uncharacterized protein n=1 Tax=Laetiporus sulphureus 93-53 TaxID=1314785 RepID=A0A165BDJ3_9APHY|nr:uncharacterized protein LAESUDRAFT_527375 [Laetiporus sulphureus 93-53]KZT00807.1 hypothetical protein LAESUDRAFT_527375 [Laetiporus sulphureus 93-53]